MPPVPMAGAGIEPAFNSDATNFPPCSCVNCQQCCAAPALQFCRPDWLELASVDADLQGVIAAWSSLPEAIRTTFMVLISTVLPQA